jgi:hypothetical protein
MSVNPILPLPDNGRAHAHGTFRAFDVLDSLVRGAEGVRCNLRGRPAAKPPRLPIAARQGGGCNDNYK